MTAEGEPTGNASSIFEELIGRVRGGAGGQGTRGKRGGARPAPATEAELTIPFLTAVQGGKTSIELTRANGRQETLEVKIPPGTDTGSKLRLKGRGEPAAPGSPGGDLIIKVKVQPHPYFRREGRDLFVDVPITIGEAVLGARIDVPTLDGSKTLPIPAGTSSGQKLRLKGQGVPAAGTKPAGDLYVVPRIQAPKNVDEESRSLIEQFTDRNPATPRDGLW
jgi:DnaJ-class molecular chaperone